MPPKPPPPSDAKADAAPFFDAAPTRCDGRALNAAVADPSFPPTMGTGCEIVGLAMQRGWGGIGGGEKGGSGGAEHIRYWNEKGK